MVREMVAVAAEGDAVDVIQGVAVE